MKQILYQMFNLMTFAELTMLWFNVPVDEVARMEIFQSSNKLVCQHEDGLERQFAGAEVEKVFERGPQQIHH